ncbi:MAG: hypothetical protein HRU20_12270 [Pseudomonadales bacterium]|nr:hypothetical protein [Pseudomonadales bacterium]
MTFPDDGNTLFTLYDTAGYLMPEEFHINRYTSTCNKAASLKPDHATSKYSGDLNFIEAFHTAKIVKKTLL